MCYYSGRWSFGGVLEQHPTPYPKQPQIEWCVRGWCGVRRQWKSLHNLCMRLFCMYSLFGTHTHATFAACTTQSSNVSASCATVYNAPERSHFFIFFYCRFWNSTRTQRTAEVSGSGQARCENWKKPKRQPMNVRFNEMINSSVSVHRGGWWSATSDTCAHRTAH